MKKIIIGFTFIEFLIALSLGMLVIAITFEIYLSAYHAYQLQIAFNTIQASAKSAITLLHATIKRAGYIGCLQLTPEFPRLIYSSYALTVENKLTGIGNNELIIRHAMLPAAMLKKPIQNHTRIFTTVSLSVTPGDIVLIADCRHAELFEVGKVTIAQGEKIITSLSPLQFDYDRTAELSRLAIERFFVAKTAYKNQDGSLIFSLFKEDMIKKRKLALVDHINTMHFLFTVDVNGKPIELTAGEVSDWTKVIAIAIEFELYYPPIKTVWYDYIAL